ncbi:MAG: flavin reductase [Microbacteriaceae bacterium]|nr:flavin reductase [Microbacteriaceae bacterium]
MMNSTDPLSPSQAFLEAFRRHGAGISVVTALKSDGSPTGFTATSLASLSASPPLATLNMSQMASSFSSIKKDSSLLIHMLGASQLELARTMSGDADQRFVGDHWEPGIEGLPLLKGVAAWMHVSVVEIMKVEFSASVAVAVRGGGLGPQEEALVYQDRDYKKTTAL